MDTTPLTTDEITYFFPVIQLSCVRSEMKQIIEQKSDVGTGINGLAVGWRRTVTTSRLMPDHNIEPQQ